MTDFYLSHDSVLKEECLHFLTENASQNQVNYFADLTFGQGGHALALLQAGSQFFVKAVDCDSEAIEHGKARLASLPPEQRKRIELIHQNFQDFPKRQERQGRQEEEGFQGILLDLGVSSHHFDSDKRGFSFRFDAPLDMRMDNRNDELETAAHIVNECEIDELERIFREYGQERFAARVAQKIAEERQEAPLETTGQLENIIFHCYPRSSRHGKIHPATRCFQALRIAVNGELDILTDTIPRLMPLLKEGGRLAIISFHSLEDRIVKKTFVRESKNSGLYKIITKKVVTPSQEEIKRNSRSRSAKLRVIEKKVAES